MSIVAGFAFFIYSNYLIWESSCLASTNLSDEFGTPKFVFYCRLQPSVPKAALLESSRRVLCSTSTRQSPDSSDQSFYVAPGDRDFLRLQCAQDPPTSAHGQAECFNECSQSPRPPLIQSANVSTSDIIPLSCKFHWTKVSSPHLTRTHSSSRELIPEVWVSQKHRKRSVSLPPPSPPGPIKLLAATEDSAHLEWQPPAESPHTSDPINYRVEIIPENSPRTFSMLTQEPQLSLEELRPAKSYDVRVYTYRPTDDQVSSEASHLKITTKPEVVRLPMVQNPKAESTDFAALKISWEPPTVDRTDRPELQINHYSVMLLNLALGRPGAHSTWTQSSEAKWSRFDVPGGFRTTSYVISGLQPDSFYKIRIFAVSNANIDGHPAVITSSPRIISRPPSGPPTKITLTHVGALTAMFSWREPEAANENGEIVAYQLAFNSPEWLSPREVTVSDSLNYTLTGLNPATNYTMAIAAATRAGIGPQSKLLHFQTTSRKTVLDTHRPQTEESFEDNGAVDSNAVVPSLVKIHNLRYITNERSILLLWSMPPTAGTAQEYRGCVIRWGPLYPGPSEAYVGLEKRAYSIEHLEPATSYLISIALLSDDGEGPSEMITAQTKPRSHGKEALIPVNLQAISVGYDWAVLTWDPPTCSSFDEGGSGSSRRAQQRASPCASELYPLQYQLRYQLLEPNSLDASQSPEKADGFVNCPTDAEAIETEVNTTVPWARLEGLQPGNRYVACVRAFSVNTQKSGATSQSRVGDWSLVQIFETTVKKSTISIDGSDAQPMLDSKVFDASPRDRTPGDPDLTPSADPRSAAGEQRSNSLNNSSDSNLWLLTPTIVVVSVLLVSVVSLVCWLKRRSFMIVRYKPDLSAEATTNGTNVCLLTPAKQANNVVGVDEKTATATMEKSVKEGHMLEYLQHQQQSQPPGHTVGIPSVVDPMGHGSSADAASRGATGSSISSVVSLLSPVKHSAAYFTTSPLSNAPPMQSQLSDVSRYTYPPPDPCRPVMVAQPGGLPGYQPTCPPPPGTAAFYTGGAGGYAQPTPHDAVPLNYCPTGGNFIRANLPPVPFLARPTDGDGVVRSGPRIDLGAGENEDTYLQHPGVPLSRAHGTLSGPGVTASDLISETSSGLLSSAFGAGHPVFQSTGGFNPSEGSGTANAYFGESSTVSSTSNSSHRFGSLPPTCATGLPPMAQPPPLPMHQSARKASLGAGAGRILSTQKETDSEAPAPHQKQQQQQQQQQRLSVKRSGPSSESKASTPRKNASTKMTKSTSANMPKAISTEELTQEMANLDGLMKDLSLITQNEFGC